MNFNTAKLLTTAILLASAATAMSQTVIKGRVVSQSSSDAIPGASVTLLKNDTVPAAQTMTAANGSFQINSDTSERAGAAAPHEWLGRQQWAGTALTVPARYAPEAAHFFDMRSKAPHPLGAGPCKFLVILLAVLAGGLRLLAALHARALIVLTPANLGQNARLGAAALETLQRVLQGLAVLHMDFRH